MKWNRTLLKCLLLNTTIMCAFTLGAQQVQEGLVYYGGDGLTAHRERFMMVNDQRVVQPHGDLPNHKSHTVHYAEAFYKNQAPVPLARQAENAGGYRHDGLITTNLHPTIRTEHLIYSDGEKIYLPHTTQELWTRAHGTPQQDDVRFIISSHKDNLQLNWTPGKSVQTANGQLERGLYQFISGENKTEEVPHNENNVVGVRTNYFRLEKWQKLGTEQFFYVRVPAQHLVSVPGISEFVVRDFPIEPKDFVDLKGTIDTYEATVANNVDLQRPLPRTIFIGEARVGKDAVAHYYAGSDLSVRFNRAFDDRIELQGNPRLGTLNVLHGIIGSRSAASWFDERGQRVIWTTPGADGVEKPLEDILNVLSLKTLLSRNNPSKIVLTIKELDLYDRNYKNLDEVLKRLARMFGYATKADGTTDVGQTEALKDALSLVVTQTQRSTKQKLNDTVYIDDDGVQQPIKGLLKKIFDVMEGAPQLYDAGGRGLLQYLSNHPERVSFFSVPIEGQLLYAPRNPLNTREAIQESIDVANGNVSRFMSINDSKDIKIVFKPLSDQFVQKVVEKLNDQVTRYLSEDAVQIIWNLCRQKIGSYEGTVDTLRDDLLTFSNKFNNASTQTLEDFVHDVEELVGTNGVTRNIADIMYLKQKLGVEVQYARDQWLAPLAGVMNNIRYLSSKEANNGNTNFDALNGINYFFDDQKQELTLVGYLIGLTDVAKFVENNKTKSGFAGLTSGIQVKRLNLLSLRDLLLDGNLTLNETTVVGISPEMLQTVQSVALDLTGVTQTALSKAANNQTGTPGLHGGNGGNLVLITNHFKDAYKEAHPQETTTFSIKKNGASGQAGQEGGDNTSVPAAVEGNSGGWVESTPTSVVASRGDHNDEKDRYHVSTLKVKGGSDKDRGGHFGPWYKDHLTIEYTKKEHRQAGIKGTKGNTGFAGGAKGLKGQAGLISIECANMREYTVADDTPVDGENGAGGRGSAGGAGSKVNYKVSYTYRPGKYNHNGTAYWANAERETTILGDGGRFREETARLLDNERGATGDTGDKGTKGGNSTGQSAQVDQLTTDELATLKDAKLQYYSTQYYALATDPVKQKLLGIFTNLPSE